MCPHLILQRKQYVCSCRCIIATSTHVQGLLKVCRSVMPWAICLVIVIRYRNLLWTFKQKTCMCVVFAPQVEPPRSKERRKKRTPHWWITHYACMLPRRSFSIVTLQEFKLCFWSERNSSKLLCQSQLVVATLPFRLESCVGYHILNCAPMKGQARTFCGGKRGGKEALVVSEVKHWLGRLDFQELQLLLSSLRPFLFLLSLSLSLSLSLFHSFSPPFALHRFPFSPSCCLPPQPHPLSLSQALSLSLSLSLSFSSSIFISLRLFHSLPDFDCIINYLPVRGRAGRRHVPGWLDTGDWDACELSSLQLSENAEE